MLPACGRGDGGQEPDVPPARALDASGCSPITYGGRGRPDLLIASSTVLQGQFIAHGVQISQSLKLVLGERDWRAGEHGVGLSGLRPDDRRLERRLRSGEVPPQCASLLGEPQRDRSRRAVELDLRARDAPDRESRARCPACGDQRVHDLRRTDWPGPGVWTRGACEVLSDRTARLRASRPGGTTSGGGRSRVRHAPGRRQRVRSERRPALRFRDRRGFPSDRRAKRVERGASCPRRAASSRRSSSSASRPPPGASRGRRRRARRSSLMQSRAPTEAARR
jgi:hypothetical protein